MKTSGRTIRLLRTANVLTDTGLDLSPLKDIATFDGRHIEMTTAWAIIWEIARRYNTTYRVITPHTHRWVMENQDYWDEEALWFAHDVIKDWSGYPQLWLPDLFDRKPPGSPSREGLNDEAQRGVLSWMKGARTVYKIVRYHILIGRELCDRVDVDSYSVSRQYFVQNQKNVPAMYKYQPLQMPQFKIRVGPTFVETNVGGVCISSPEDDIAPPVEGTMKDLALWDIRMVQEEKAEKRRFDLFLKMDLDQKYASGDSTLVGSPASARLKSGQTTAVASPSKR